VILDLNAKRAARAAKRGDAMQMILGTETFDLVEEMPLEIGELANDGRISDAFKLMLRDPDGDWDRLKKCRPSFNDVLDVVEFFGTALGESVRSIESSQTTGPQSKSTSTATTDETSLATVTELPVSTPDDSSPTSPPSPTTPPLDAS
jgi:hypothetical protein